MISWSSAPEFGDATKAGHHMRCKVIILWLTLRNTYLVFFLLLHRDSKPLGISWVTEACWIGDGYHRNQLGDWRLEPFIPISYPPMRREDWTLSWSAMVNYLIIQAYKMMAPKSPKGQDKGASRLAQMCWWWEGGVAQVHMEFTLLPTQFVLCISCIWLFLSTALVITEKMQAKCFLEPSEPSQQRTDPRGSFWFVANPSEAQVTTHICSQYLTWWVVRWGQFCGPISPLIVHINFW